MKILFLCTHNRCRSILAEAIANHFGADLILAASAGSDPAGQVHPLTLYYLQQCHIPSEGLRSKSWDEMADFEPDYVITLCDSAAGESCPVWLGNTRTIHWGLPDPSAVNADEQSVAEAFLGVIEILKCRIMQIRYWLEQGLPPEQIQQKMLRPAVSGPIELA